MKPQALYWAGALSMMAGAAGGAAAGRALAPGHPRTGAGVGAAAGFLAGLVGSYFFVAAAAASEPEEIPPLAPGQLVAFGDGLTGAILAVEGEPGSWVYTGATPAGVVHEGPLEDWTAIT